MATQADPFAVIGVFFVLLLGFALGYHSWRLKKRGYMEKTIRSGSRDPITYLANQENKGKVNFLLILCMVMLVYSIIRYLFT